jgi:FkbM family methyltransferase
MKLSERLHLLHRVWRYRLRSEKNEVAFLLSRDLRGKTAVDIGANRGIYSYWMHKKVGPQGNVIAFEPQVELVSYMRDVKNDFRLDRLEIAEVGLSSCGGTRELIRPRDHWGGASLELESTPDADTFTIDVTTLDEFFQDRPDRPVSFIKCDVEGHELEVFEGGQQLLRDDRPDLLFECHDDQAEEGRLFSLLNGLDYEGFFFYQKELVPISRYEALRSSIEKPYLNFVFVPQENAETLR